MQGRAGQDRAGQDRVKYSVTVAIPPTHYRVSRCIIGISVCAFYSQPYPPSWPEPYSRAGQGRGMVTPHSRSRVLGVFCSAVTVCEQYHEQVFILPSR